MPHVGRVKDEEGAKCPFAKQQSPTEEKQERSKLLLLYCIPWRPALATRDKIYCTNTVQLTNLLLLLGVLDRFR